MEGGEGGGEDLEAAAEEEIRRWLGGDFAGREREEKNGK